MLLIPIDKYILFGESSDVDEKSARLFSVSNCCDDVFSNKFSLSLVSSCSSILLNGAFEFFVSSKFDSKVKSSNVCWD